jgi:hypothetical protein
MFKGLTKTLLFRDLLEKNRTGFHFVQSSAQFRFEQKQKFLKRDYQRRDAERVVNARRAGKGPYAGTIEQEKINFKLMNKVAVNDRTIRRALRESKPKMMTVPQGSLQLPSYATMRTALPAASSSTPQRK